MQATSTTIITTEATATTTTAGEHNSKQNAILASCSLNRKGKNIQINSEKCGMKQREHAQQ